MNWIKKLNALEIVAIIQIVGGYALLVWIHYMVFR